MAQAHLVVGALTVEGGFETGTHTVDVALVDLCLDLVVRQVVDLPDLLPRGDRLPEHDVQQADFAVDRRLDVEVADALADELHVALHVVEVLLHLLDLHRTVERILHLPLDVQLAFLFGQFVVLLRLQPLLAGDQGVPVKLLVLLPGPLLARHVEIQLRLVLPQREFLLLHRDQRIAQDVLLFGQLGLAVQDFERERRVAQHDQHIALFDGGTLLDHKPLDDARFEGTELHGGDGLHLPGDADVVVEFTAHDLPTEIVRASTRSVEELSRNRSHNTKTRNSAPAR